MHQTNQKHVFHELEACRRGVTLVELLVAIAIFGVIVLVLSALFTDVLKAGKFVQIEIERLELVKEISRTVHCSNSLSVFGPTSQNIPVGASVELKDRASRPISGAVGTGVFSNARPWKGNWWLRSTWNGSGIDVDIAKTKISSDEISEDPLHPGVLLDFNHRKARVFGGGSVRTLCAPSQGATNSLYLAKANSAYRAAGEGYHAKGCSGWMFDPTFASSLCTNACKNASFAAGWLTECAGVVHHFDADGNHAGWSSLNVDDHVFGCMCVK